MNERKPQGSGQQPAPADDHMPTTRLPPIPALPGQPPGRAATASSPAAPASRPSMPSGSTASGPPSDPPVSLPLARGPRLWRHWSESIASVFKSASRSTRPVVPSTPPRSAAEAAAHPSEGEHALLARRRVGVFATAIGLVLVIFGIAFGLRGAPTSSSLEPVVLGAIVVARALAGLGMLAFGMWLLRLGERLLLEKH
jgi:hypothetical protein